MRARQTSWHIYTETSEAWEAMLRDCRAAKISICLEQFIFTSVKKGQIGREFVDVLLKKQAEGVRVRLLLDAVGSYRTWTSSVVSELKRAGVEIVFHTTLSKLPKKRLFSFFLRDHRKLLIIDDQIAHIGGVVITEKARHWRDTNVRLVGPVVGHLGDAFHAIWGTGQRVKVHAFEQPRMSFDGFSVVPNAPRIRHKQIYRDLLKRVGRARRSIHLTSPYFGPPPKLTRALLRAARRGVDVRILLPGRSDWKIADLVAQSFFGRLMKSGVRIFRSPRFIHAKSAIIDAGWTSVGSCNLDYVSFFLNYELNITSSDQAFARSFEQQFRLDCTEAIEVDLEAWERRSVLQRLAEKIAFPLRLFV